MVALYDLFPLDLRNVGRAVLELARFADLATGVSTSIASRKIQNITSQ
jgi:hypothetical protein